MYAQASVAALKGDFAGCLLVLFDQNGVVRHVYTYILGSLGLRALRFLSS